MECRDLVEGTYLRQTTNQFGSPAGSIAVVHDVGTSWTGEWYFQLRYLNQPVGTQTKGISPWSVNLREKDLVHFELVGTWIPADTLQISSPPPLKPQHKRRASTCRRRKIHLYQLCLFDDF